MPKKILISAGHTNTPGQDRGAVGSGYVEGRETLRLRDNTAAILRGKGLDVVEDGADGINEPLKKALRLIPGTDAAIEFHFNAGPKKATGVEVLSKPSKKRLAQRIAKAIGAATGLRIRGEQGWKSDTSGQHHRLAFCSAGGLIVEVCFISNRSDMDAYERHFEAICEGVAYVLSTE